MLSDIYDIYVTFQQQNSEKNNGMSFLWVHSTALPSLAAEYMNRSATNFQSTLKTKAPVSTTLKLKIAINIVIPSNMLTLTVY